MVSVPRVQEALENTEGFAERILTKAELEQMSSRKQVAHFVAKRFAAKEAVVKALGNGIGNGLSWHHIEIYNEVSGAPKVTLSGPALDLMQALGATECLLSLSDEKDSAVAFVVLN